MKICIVDDDRTTVERIRCSIPWDKYGINETFAAYDAQNAKQLLDGHQIDLMLFDIQMPGLSGLELMEWIRAEQLDVQVIFLTNYAEFAYAQKAMRLGSFDYICKGTDLAEVEKAIARCVQEISKIRDRQRLSEDGILVAIICIEPDSGQVVSGPDIISRGFVYIREAEEIVEEAKQVAQDVLDNALSTEKSEWIRLKNSIKEALGEYVWRKTRRRPMILPVIMEVSI